MLAFYLWARCGTPVTHKWENKLKFCILSFYKLKLCVCVCIYVYIYIYTRIYIYTQEYIYILDSHIHMNKPPHTLLWFNFTTLCLSTCCISFTLAGVKIKDATRLQPLEFNVNIRNG